MKVKSDPFTMIMLVSGMVWLFIGCFGTVTPKQVKSTQPSFDANGNTSGFVGWTNQPQAHSGVFTAAAVNRYNLLAAKWGSDARFVPAIKPWDGVALELDGKGFTNYVLTPLAIYNFQLLAAVQRANSVKP